MITPHDTAQYGQMLRVSVVRAILNCRISARACDRSKPRATAPPTVVALRKPRRVNSTGTSMSGKSERLIGKSNATLLPQGITCQGRARRQAGALGSGGAV